MNEPTTPADTLTPEQTEAQAQIDAIRADTTHAYHRGDPQAQATMNDLYRTRWPQPGVEPPMRTPALATPSPAPTPPSTAQERQAQLAALDAAPYRVGETIHAREQAGRDLVRQLYEPLEPGKATDPVIAAAEAELRDLKPDTPEWARVVTKIDERVLAQPVRPGEVIAIQRAAEGLQLRVTPAEAQDLGRVCNAIRHELGEAEVEPVIMRGLAVIKRAQQDIEAGLVNESWADVAPDLEAEWGRDGEWHVQNIREALLKMPPTLRAGLLRDKRVFYHEGVLRFLAEIGGKIPVGPPS